MNYVKSNGANGAIAMEEYSYPLGANFPVLKVLNKAGYYTLPTQYNVAVALTKAQINNDPNDPNYLTQKLDNVYVNPDKRTYPLSSYVYAIIPTAADDSRMNTAKRQTIVDFLKYSICEGQKSVGPIGYSPLPINLVQAGLTQVNKLKLADGGVSFDASIIKDVKNCHNPTFVAGKPSQNHLAKVAPFPAACDRPGQGPCGETVGAFNENPDGNGKVPDNPDAKGDDSGAGAGTGDATGGGTPTAGGDGASVPDAPPGGSDPGLVDDLGIGGGTTTDGGQTAAVVATTLSSDGSAGPPGALTALVVGLFLATLVVPTVVSQTVSRRRGGR